MLIPGYKSKEIILKKIKSIALILALVLIVTEMPLKAFAETELHTGYRILLSSNSYIYTGKAIEAPFYVVKDTLPGDALYEDFKSGKYLAEDYILPVVNYDFEYSHNVECGKAAITVTGKGDYSGTITASFQINKKEVDLKAIVNEDKSVSISSDIISFCDSGVNEVKALLGDYSLSEGFEYIVSDLGEIVIKKDFLEGKTGYEIGSLDVELIISTDNFFGYVTVKGYDISNLYYSINAPVVFNGKNRKADIYISGASEGKDYKIIYAKKTRKKIGTYRFTVKGIGDCVGSFKGSFKIVPKRTTKITAKESKRAVTVKWKKVASCSGYQVQLVRKTKGDGDYEIDYEIYRRSIIKGKNHINKVFKKVDKAKCSHVRVRSYKTINNKRYYSAWKYKTL